MRGSVGVGRLLMAGMLVWAAAGCSSVVEGAAEPASGQEGLFDPCKDIPDSVLEEVGLDPATEEVDIAGVAQPGWKICTWSGSWYFAAMYANEHSTDDIRANPDYAQLRDIEVGQRKAIEFRRTADLDDGACYVAVDTGQGSVWLKVYRKGIRPIEEPTCQLAFGFAGRFEGLWPN
ncbi:hypothetical protein G9444_4219 [Rhodococcus erythropolis]|uniref:DUF3558 domain-containing protein n=3 Tax=Nocardiaceae TaxID=85025 RepID=A0A6G9CWP8_RHOER|nr:DUF3558 domain-containing protein [Rhodococcus erythropolis]QIP41463.1 hypothetical protein G9444_4219 [Rhodococcus erythropolis]